LTSYSSLAQSVEQTTLVTTGIKTERDKNIKHNLCKII